MPAGGAGSDDTVAAAILAQKLVEADGHVTIEALRADPEVAKCLGAGKDKNDDKPKAKAEKPLAKLHSEQASNVDTLAKKQWRTSVQLLKAQHWEQTLRQRLASTTGELSEARTEMYATAARMRREQPSDLPSDSKPQKAADIEVPKAEDVPPEARDAVLQMQQALDAFKQAQKVVEDSQEKERAAKRQKTTDAGKDSEGPPAEEDAMDTGEEPDADAGAEEQKQAATASASSSDKGEWTQRVQSLINDAEKACKDAVAAAKVAPPPRL